MTQSCYETLVGVGLGLLQRPPPHHLRAGEQTWMGQDPRGSSPSIILSPHRTKLGKAPETSVHGHGPCHPDPFPQDPAPQGSEGPGRAEG